MAAVRTILILKSVNFKDMILQIDELCNFNQYKSTIKYESLNVTYDVVT